jgi:hypothetical protein
MSKEKKHFTNMIKGHELDYVILQLLLKSGLR